MTYSSIILKYFHCTSEWMSFGIMNLGLPFPPALEDMDHLRTEAASLLLRAAEDGTLQAVLSNKTKTKKAPGMDRDGAVACKIYLYSRCNSDCNLDDLAFIYCRTVFFLEPR